MNITCPNCGAPLVYDVETDQMKCSYCDQNTNRTGSNTPQINAAADETTTVSSHVTPDMDNMEMNLYHCSSCGADLLAGKHRLLPFVVTAVLHPSFLNEFPKKQNQTRSFPLSSQSNRHLIVSRQCEEKERLPLLQRNHQKPSPQMACVSFFTALLWGMAVCRFLFSIYAEIKNLRGLLSGSPHRAFVTI